VSWLLLPPLVSFGLVIFGGVAQMASGRHRRHRRRWPCAG